MMKVLGFVILLIFICGPLKASDSKPAPVGQPTSLYYFEVVPKMVTELKLSADPACGGIATRQYEAYEQLQSAEKDKVVPVRVFSIYATCLHQAAKKSASSLKFPSDDKHMTHVYVTADQGMKIQWN